MYIYTKHIPFDIPFAQGFALQSSGKHCSPRPDSVLRKLIFQARLLLRRSVFFHRHRYSYLRTGQFDRVVHSGHAF